MVVAGCCCCCCCYCCFVLSAIPTAIAFATELHKSELVRLQFLANTDVLLASTGNFINDKLLAKIRRTRDASLVSTAAILGVCHSPGAIKSSGKELEEKRALKCGVCDILAVISVVLLRLLLRVFVKASPVGC